MDELGRMKGMTGDIPCVLSLVPSNNTKEAVPLKELARRLIPFAFHHHCSSCRQPIRGMIHSREEVRTTPGCIVLKRRAWGQRRTVCRRVLLVSEIYDGV